MGLSYDLCLLIFIVPNLQAIILSTTTKDWLIEFHDRTEPAAAKRIAKKYAMFSRGPV